MMSGIANPFRTWAELARGLRDYFVDELGDKRPYSPYDEISLQEVPIGDYVFEYLDASPPSMGRAPRAVQKLNDGGAHPDD